MNNAVIKLLPEHLQTIRTHAESTYPDECCGIILGYLASVGKTVVEIIPTANAWNTEAANFTNDHKLDDERRRYAIAPQDMLQGQRKARDSSLNIIGIYHSHPDHPAVPSECDRLYAWPEYSYIIVSVQNGKAGELKSWSLDNNHQFQPETIKDII
ncbi:Mov34/MPN/PAD-1 family protein [Nostoc sp. NIES-4103]|nr:Mov34/MPN/PAD-1 family protein [Nostoc sp. NIES-4103]